MNVGKGRKEWRHFAEVDKRRERDEDRNCTRREVADTGRRWIKTESWGGRGKLRVVSARRVGGGKRLCRIGGWRSALHPHADASLAHGWPFGTPAPKTGGDAGNACMLLRVLLDEARHACCALLRPIVWCALSCSGERCERAVSRLR
jgi:hypothetical protein